MPRRPRLRRAPAAARALVPTFDEALEALLSDEAGVAVARFAARVLADPGDEPSRHNHAIALYEAGRWAQAAAAFERLLAADGCDSEESVPMLFSLGYCRLELDDDVGSLIATTGFLDFGNERHPFYWDGVQNTACAWNRLGFADESAALYRSVLAKAPNPYAFNGLALALDDLDRPAEGAWVLETARWLGAWDEVLENSLDHLRDRTQSPPRRTALTARPWSRRRVIETSFRILGFDARARPPRHCDWGA